MNSRVVRFRRDRPSFMEGMARVIDVGGTLNQYDSDDLMDIFHELQARRLAMPSGLEAETKAMQEVWATVGQCIRDSIRDFEASEQGAMRVWTSGDEQVRRR